MTYTLWSPSSTYDNIRQPDGAIAEGCAMIRLDSMHSTNNWHDIPCAFNQVKQYLCETPAVDMKASSETPSRDRGWVGQFFPPLEDGNACQNDLFQCGNGECIMEHYVCNSVVDCKDGSDEVNCTSEGRFC